MSIESLHTQSGENFTRDGSYWDIIREKLINAGHKKYYTGPDLVADLEGEVAFANRVLDCAQEAVASGGKKIHLLLDIDNTIGAYEKDWQDYTKRKFVIRPVLSELLKELKMVCEKNNAVFDVGFISNRVATHSVDQLRPGGQFEGIEGYVNRDLVLSSRDEKASDSEEYRDDRLAYLKNMEVVNSESPVLKRRAEMNPDGVDKLVVLERLKQKMEKDERCIVVDDSPIYPEILNNESGMYGVCLRDKGYYSRA